MFIVGYMAVLAGLAATVWAAGRLVMHGVMAERASRGPLDVPFAVTMAVGFAVLAQAALLLGLMGALRRAAVIGLVVVVHVAAVGEWRRVAIAAREGWRVTRRRMWWTGTAMLFAMPMFLLALYPPIGFDETLYHLPYARAFAASGSLPRLETLRFPVFAQLAEALNAAVLLVADDIATQVVGWLAFAAGVGLAWTWARELSGDVGGGIAAAMLVGSPIVVYVAGTGYIEPMVALLGAASLYAVERATRAAAAGWIVVAGVLAGSAASAKYLGLYFVPAAAVLLVWRRLSAARVRAGNATPAPDARRVQDVAPRFPPMLVRELVWYGAAALIAMTSTYGRLIAYTGNPVFPFMPELFGPSVWHTSEFEGLRGVERLAAAVTLVWDAAFHRHDVGAMPHLSPAFAIGFPIAAIGAWRRPALRPLLAIAVGYVLIAPVNSRYFLPIALLWAVTIGAASATLIGAHAANVRVRAAALSAAVLMALGGEAYAIHRLHRLGLPPATPTGREQLLASHLPLYPAIAFVNRTAGPTTIYGVEAERMMDYASGTLLGDVNGPASHARVAARIDSLGSVSAALDAIGATHLLVPMSSTRAAFWTARAAADPRLDRVYQDAHAIVYRVRPLPNGDRSGSAGDRLMTRQSGS